MADSLQLRYWIEQVELFNDQTAYEKIFDHYYDGLHLLAFSFVKDHQIAEEIVCDSFMAIWRQRDRLLQIENLKLYLFVAVKNFSIRQLSKNKSAAHFDFAQMEFSDIGNTTKNPEDLMISRETHQHMQQAIEKLPAKCKLIFRLVREEGLKYKEVAQLLDISPKTVEAQMTIAAKKITDSLKLVFKE